MRLSVLLLAAACLPLACCSSSGEPVGAPQTVSYRITGGDLGFAYASAQQYCRAYDAAPVLQSLSPFNTTLPSDRAGDRNVVYSCSGPSPDVATAGLHSREVPGVGSSVPPPAPAR